MGFNSAFKGLKEGIFFCLHDLQRNQLSARQAHLLIFI